MRLAAQIKANVEQLDMLILAFEQTSAFIKDNNYPEIKIKRDLASQINKLFKDGKIHDELKPKDLSRFCDNLYRLFIKTTPEKQIKNTIKQAIDVIKSTKNNQVPLSISLFQYFVAVLIDNKIIQTSTQKYYWYITKEVIDIYPSLKTISSLFKYEEGS